jgi:hypothetical protein
MKSASRCQRRLFVLDAEKLCYYESNKKGPPKYRPSKTIELDEVVMMAEAPDRAEAHEREHCFSVATPSRVFCEHKSLSGSKIYSSSCGSLTFSITLR